MLIFCLFTAMKFTAQQLYPAQVGIAPQRLHFPPPYRNPIHPNVAPNEFQYFPGHSGAQHLQQPHHPSSSVHKPLRKVNSRHSESDIISPEPNNSFNNPTIIPEEKKPIHHIYHPTNVTTLQPLPPTVNFPGSMYQQPPIAQPLYIHNPWLPSESMNVPISGNYSPVESGPCGQRLVCRFTDEQVVENTT